MRRLLVFAILLEFTFARSALAQFAHGRFSCPDQQKYLWGGYYGVAWVHGAADQGVSRGTTATFSFIPLRPGGRWMWDIRLGYTQFPRVSGHSNVTAMDVSPNISIVILRSEPSIFVIPDQVSTTSAAATPKSGSMRAQELDSRSCRRLRGKSPITTASLLHLPRR